MMRHVTRCLIGVIVISSFSAMAKDAHISKALQAAMSDIASHAKVILVPDPGTSEANFREDADPATLEIVVLARPSDGPAGVSDDGEVIFVHKDTPDAVQQSLFTKAFYLQAKARLAASPSSSRSSSRPR